MQFLWTYKQNDKLKKAKLENGFYNIIQGERAYAGKTLSVINPATGTQLAIAPDVDRVTCSSNQPTEGNTDNPLSGSTCIVLLHT
jgi:hypothetical protein